MRVVYGDKVWTFETPMTVNELLKATELANLPVLVMADGRLVRSQDVVSDESRVLIINAANGG